MPLESATYLHQLEPSNPPATDQLRQADDHLRLIKSVLQATFPNIEGAVTKTHEELNASAFSYPIGIVSLWYGSSGSVPSGWAICNGQTVSRTDNAGTITTPDLRGKVAMGALAGTYEQGSSYGSATASGTAESGGAHTHAVASSGGHSHTVTVQGHALTVNEMPAHTHSVAASQSGGSGAVEGGYTGSSQAITSGSTGGGQAHTHGATIAADTGAHTHTTDSGGAHTHTVSGVSTLQPSLALHYIIKI